MGIQCLTVGRPRRRAVGKTEVSGFKGGWDRGMQMLTGSWAQCWKEKGPARRVSEVPCWHGGRGRAGEGETQNLLEAWAAGNQRHAHARGALRPAGCASRSTAGSEEAVQTGPGWGLSRGKGQEVSGTRKLKTLARERGRTTSTLCTCYKGHLDTLFTLSEDELANHLTAQGDARTPSWKWGWHQMGRASFLQDEKPYGADGGAGCTAVRTHSGPLNCTLLKHG